VVLLIEIALLKAQTLKNHRFGNNKIFIEYNDQLATSGVQARAVELMNEECKVHLDDSKEMNIIPKVSRETQTYRYVQRSYSDNRNTIKDNENIFTKTNLAELARQQLSDLHNLTKVKEPRDVKIIKTQQKKSHEKTAEEVKEKARRRENEEFDRIIAEQEREIRELPKTIERERSSSTLSIRSDILIESSESELQNKKTEIRKVNEESKRLIDCGIRMRSQNYKDGFLEVVQILLETKKLLDDFEKQSVKIINNFEPSSRLWSRLKKFNKNFVSTILNFLHLFIENMVESFGTKVNEKVEKLCEAIT